MIVDYHALEAFCDHAHASGSIALDTEFQRERRYRPLLQLVQVATREKSVLIDPLAIEDLTPLWELVADPEVEVLLHDATQDLEIFHNHSGLVPSNIVDTQIAAAMVGLGEQPGFAEVAKKLLGLTIEKAGRVTDWARRPLSPRQEKYALDDVQYLHALWDKLRQMLVQLDRLHWFRTETAVYQSRERFMVMPELAWKKVSGHRSLRPLELAVLRELAAWREIAADRINIPRKHVIADDILVDIARMKPASLGQLRELRRLSGRDAARHGDDLLQAVQMGLEVPPAERPRITKSRRASSDMQPVVDMVVTLVKARAREHSIASGYLAARRDVESAVAWWFAKNRSNDDVPLLLDGWRLALAGEDVIAMLDGRFSLGVDPKSQSVVLLAGGSKA